jgi:uncharacterized protein with PIN domain
MWYQDRAMALSIKHPHTKPHARSRARRGAGLTRGACLASAPAGPSRAPVLFNGTDFAHTVIQAAKTNDP